MTAEKLTEIFVLGDRIRELRLRKIQPNGKPWSQKYLAKKVGVKQPTVFAWESTRHSMSADNYMRLKKALGVSDQDLTGRPSEIEVQTNVKLVEPGKPVGGVILISTFSILLEAFNSFGDDSLVGNPNAAVPVSTDWLQDNNIDPSGLIAYQLQDNIQNPPWEPGTVVLIDSKDTQVVDGKCYVVEQDGLLRLWRVFSQPGGYRLISSNADYPDESVDAGTAFIRGRVRQAISPAL
jgi:transcriptional regulator with XRE-family HTH domain